MLAFDLRSHIRTFGPSSNTNKSVQRSKKCSYNVFTELYVMLLSLYKIARKVHTL